MLSVSNSGSKFPNKEVHVKNLFTVLLISLTLLVVLPLESQPKYVTEWTKTINNGNNDNAKVVVLDSNDNV